MTSNALNSHSKRTARDGVASEVLDAVKRLLDAGERFSTLSVQTICGEAGVSRSAFYVNFSDKTDLLLRLLEGAMDEIAGVADGWLNAEPFLGLEPLVTAQLNAIRVYRKHSTLLRATAEMAAQDDTVATLWSAWLGDITAAFAKRIRAGQRAGIVRQSLSPTVAAKFVVLGSDRLLREEVMLTNGTSDRRVAREMARAIWSMLHCAGQSDVEAD
jgi:AcrR family transcriptional regulator